MFWFGVVSKMRSLMTSNHLNPNLINSQQRVSNVIGATTPSDFWAQLLVELLVILS